MWSWCWCPGKHVKGPLDLWLQVWHQPREYYPVWAEHRDSSHRRPGITLRVCGRGSALSTHFRHESGLSRHKENLLLRRFPQVSLQQSAPVLTSDLFTISISSSVLFTSGCFHILWLPSCQQRRVVKFDPCFAFIFNVVFSNLHGRLNSGRNSSLRAVASLERMWFFISGSVQLQLQHTFSRVYLHPVNDITELLHQYNVTFQFRSAFLNTLRTRPFACCLSTRVMLFSGYIFTCYILLQKGCPTFVCGCWFYCLFIFVPSWSVAFHLHSAAVLESVPSVVGVALVTVSLEGQQKPGHTEHALIQAGTSEGGTALVGIQHKPLCWFSGLEKSCEYF